MVAADCELSDVEYRRLSRAVQAHCGIYLHDGKRELVRARLARLLRATDESPSEFLSRILDFGRGEEFIGLIDSLSTNLTGFFREGRHFDFLRTSFLPSLLAAKARRGDRRVRAWCAACSSGEEAYSLAITLAEAADLTEWNCRVLATDISTRMLRTAEAAVYERDRLSPVPPNLRARYFNVETRNGRTLMRARPELAELVRVRHLNLVAPWPFEGPFDFIFCRNVMIYFDKPTQQRLVTRFHDCLDSGGLLFTGHSESLTGISHQFQYVEPTIYRKA